MQVQHLNVRLSPYRARRADQTRGSAFGIREGSVNDGKAGAKPIESWERLSEQNGATPQRVGPSPSDLNSLGQLQCILNVDAEIPHCVLDLGMAKQDLDRPKVAGSLVNHRSLRSPQGMRTVVLPTKPDRRHPLIDQPGVLPSGIFPAIAIALFGISLVLANDCLLELTASAF